MRGACAAYPHQRYPLRAGTYHEPARRLPTRAPRAPSFQPLGAHYSCAQASHVGCTLFRRSMDNPGRTGMAATTFRCSCGSRARSYSSTEPSAAAMRVIPGAHTFIRPLNRFSVAPFARFGDECICARFLAPRSHPQCILPQPAAANRNEQPVPPLFGDRHLAGTHRGSSGSFLAMRSGSQKTRTAPATSASAAIAVKGTDCRSYRAGHAPKDDATTSAQPRPTHLFARMSLMTSGIAPMPMIIEEMRKAIVTNKPRNATATATAWNTAVS
jgi:hypothetical protein